MPIISGTKLRESIPSEDFIEEKIEKMVTSAPKVTNTSNVRQLMRWLSKQDTTNVEAGYDRIADVNTELNALYQQGYRLFATHYLGENPEAFGVLYILTL